MPRRRHARRRADRGAVRHSSRDGRRQGPAAPRQARLPCARLARLEALGPHLRVRRGRGDQPVPRRLRGREHRRRVHPAVASGRREEEEAVSELLRLFLGLQDGGKPGARPGRRDQRGCRRGAEPGQARVRVCRPYQRRPGERERGSGGGGAPSPPSPLSSRSPSAASSLFPAPSIRERERAIRKGRKKTLSHSSSFFENRKTLSFPSFFPSHSLSSFCSLVPSLLPLLSLTSHRARPSPSRRRPYRQPWSITS